MRQVMSCQMTNVWPLFKSAGHSNQLNILISIPTQVSHQSIALQVCFMW